jgi:hypothetical protein
MHPKAMSACAAALDKNLALILFSHDNILASDELAAEAKR